MKTPHDKMTARERQSIAEGWIAQQRRRYASQNVASEAQPMPAEMYHGTPHNLPGFWARIIGQGQHPGGYVVPDNGTGYFVPDNRMEYEWEAVFRMQKEDGSWGWGSLPEASGDGLPSIASDRMTDGVRLINPAVSAESDRNIPIGSLVWLTPAESIGLDTNTGTGESPTLSQKFLFTLRTSKVRPFAVMEPIIPKQVIDADTGATRNLFALPVVFLDADEHEAALSNDFSYVYPTCSQLDAVPQAEWEANHPGTDPNEGDAGSRQPINTGVIWGDLAAPCYGWAKWVENAYVLNNQVYGQYQIVSVQDTIVQNATPAADVLPAAEGILSIAPNYSIKLYNHTGTTLSAGQQLSVYYEKAWRMWLVMAASTSTASHQARWVLASLGGAGIDSSVAIQTGTVISSWDGAAPPATINLANKAASGGGYEFSADAGTYVLASYVSASTYAIVQLPNGQGYPARHVVFKLAEDLAKTDAEADATTEDWFDGVEPDTSIVVMNCPLQTDYAFSGLDGEYGLASYDPAEDKYRIEVIFNTIAPTSGFCRAQHAWQRDGTTYGQHDFVSVKNIADPTASPVTEVGDAFDLLLLKIATDSTPRDPNIETGQMLGYAVDPTSGLAYCTTDYLDDCIGTIKACQRYVEGEGEDAGTFTPVIGQGWELLEAAEGRTIVGETFPTTENPADDTPHGDTSTESETTGIAVDTHGNHYHAQNFTTVNHDGGSGAIINSASSTTGNENATLTHDVTDNGHSHVFETPNLRAAWMRRYDNSYTPPP